MTETTDMAVPSTGQLIALAVSKGAAIDVIERLSALMERQAAIAAKEAWHTAIAGFKSECPVIIKNNPVRGRSKKDDSGKVVELGPVHYHFAGYDDIKAITGPLERKWGVVTGYTFEVTNSGNLLGRLRVTVGSHTEEFSFGVPIPKGINTNGTQDFGSAQTYLKRYLYCAAFDIVVTDEDNDGRGLNVKLTGDQIGELNDLISQIASKKIKFNKTNFFEYFGLEEQDDFKPDLGDIEAKHFAEAKKLLTDRLEGRA